LKILSFLAPYFPGIFYRELTLRVHAYNLRSKFDIEGQIPWSQGKTKQFFTEWTPHKAYVKRVRAAEKCDYVSKLNQIKVPTLILTPEEDRIIGPEASQIMLKGIPNAVEQIIPRTGHMFRFSHPALYSKYIKEFITKLTKEYDELSELPKENKS
jgi:pimeloyl-ACP methyl ester carboxylesterase